MSAFRSLRSRAKNNVKQVGPISIGLVVCTWWLMLFRVLPPVLGDFGMFVTVAERLKAGDQLYANVFENKDPLFHYSLAVSRAISPYGSWILQFVWLIIAAIGSFAISKTLCMSPRASVLCGFVVAPLIITGALFGAGTSHLPGIALTMLVVAFVLNGRWMLAGCSIGVLLFLKITMFPAALMILLVVAYRHRQTSNLIRALGTLVATSICILSLLAIRGELLPYIQTLRDNSSYANSPQTTQGLRSLFDHLSRLVSPNSQFLLIVCLVLFFGLLAFRRGSNRESWGPEKDDVLAIVAIGALISLLVSAFTALWINHAQVFVPTILLLGVLTVSLLPFVFTAANLYSSCALVAFSVLLAGIPSASEVVRTFQYARADINSHASIPISARAIIASGSPTTLARLGGGDDDGFANGLDEWTLACRRFGQGAWEPSSVLEETSKCLPNANVILVMDDFTTEAGDEVWNHFVFEAEALLHSSYSCTNFQDGRVCRRTGA